MKNLYKIFILPALMLFGIFSCKKQENRVIFEGGTAPVLTASVAGSIPLSYANKDNEALNSHGPIQIINSTQGLVHLT
jgi:hypothetical protein